jgi:hypothetical protein
LKFFLDFFSPPRRKKFQSLLVRPYIYFFRHFQRKKKQAFVEFCFEKTAWPFDIRYPREWRESFGTGSDILITQSGSFHYFSPFSVHTWLRSISNRSQTASSSELNQIDLRSISSFQRQFTLGMLCPRSI